MKKNTIFDKSKNVLAKSLSVLF